MRWNVLRRSRSALCLCCILLIILLQIPPVVSIDIPEDIRYGPFIDKTVYNIIYGVGPTLLALQVGEIDIGSIDPVYSYDFDIPSNIDIFESPRNGYPYIRINCDQYPLNISGFRRAFAFAFNKTKAVHYAYEGHASLHDSLVPSTNRWCSENLLEPHYYDAEIDIANSILDELGFSINSTTGYRNAPNGDPFYVEGYSYPFYFNNRVASLAIEALDSLNIHADWFYPDFYPWELPPTWSMLLFGRDFEYDDLELDITSSNYSNDTYDFWMSEFQSGESYREVRDAAIEIQKILHYEVPLLVVCQSNYLQGYRTDHFQGLVVDLCRYLSGPWTLRRAHKIDGMYGGILNIGLNHEPSSFNIYTTNSHMILENLYSSLYSRDPNMNPIPDLAVSMLVETHSNNSIVPNGHMRFTFDILQNATWSDGRTLTAEDVVFTFIYQLESGSYDNPAADSLGDLISIYTPSTYRVVFEFSSESYWHFNKIAYEYIIPKHIFTRIGYSGWNTWNPVFNPNEPHVTCGPFVLTNFEAGEYYELTSNPEYHWLPYRPPLSPSVTNTSTQPTTPDSIFEIVSITLSTTYVVVIAGIILLLIKDRKHSE